MKTIKRHCMFVIMFMVMVCMACGCAASPSSGYGAADAESEKYIEQTDVELPESSEEPVGQLMVEPLRPESSEEPESLPTAEPLGPESSKESGSSSMAGPLGPESGEESGSSSMAGPLDSESSGEKESKPTEKPLEPESIEEVGYPSEEEIAALGIPEDMLAYWLVLNNRKPFFSVNQDGQKFFWNEYFWFLQKPWDEYNAYRFMIVDMDRDGRDEIILECDPGTKHILRYEDGEVYGYQFVIRAMLRISEDGIYDASDGAQDNYFYRITELNKDGYTEELLAELHGEHYEIGGKEVTWEEFYAYAQAIYGRETERIDYTEDMLDNYLLGELSEQEIAIVKRIPAENMLENEPDYQEHKQALQLYAGVLKGEQDVILVTDDTFDPSSKMLPIYFSLVDMDGDEIPELVFDCYFDVAWILHYREGEIYGYPLDVAPDITTDGVFGEEFNKFSPTGYARITAFEEDGCRIEPVEDYQKGSYHRVRYYFFSEETMAQWLE